MTEKITLTPNEVRGLGNIVSHKTEKNFLPVDCRIHTPQQATVNGVTRDVFLVDMSPAGTLVDTYLTVDGPSIVELSDEEITFNVALHRSDGVRVKSVPLVCMTGDSVLEVTSNEYGYAEFTVPNTFTEGRYTFTFASQTIVIQDDVRFDNAYHNHSFVVVGDSGESYFELMCPDNPIQIDSVAHLISRFCVDGVGIPGSTLYFFEEYVKSVLRCSASLESFVSGETSVLSVECKDSDGSAVQEAPVYFFIQEAVYSNPEDLILTVSKSQVMVGETTTITATLVDVYDRGVPNFTFELRKTSYYPESERVAYLTTGADGTATYTYTGVGAGDIAFFGRIPYDGDYWESDYVFLEDCFTYGTNISQFLANEPATPRITNDNNRITVYEYYGGQSGDPPYGDVPVILDHVFNSDDQWIMETTIDTPTYASIVVTVGYPSTVQPGATSITAGHDPRVTEYDDNAFMKSGTDTPTIIEHTFTANDKLIVFCEGGKVECYINDINETYLDYMPITASTYYIGYLLVPDTPQFFKNIKIKRITPLYED